MLERKEHTLKLKKPELLQLVVGNAAIKKNCRDMCGKRALCKAVLWLGQGQCLSSCQVIKKDAERSDDW